VRLPGRRALTRAAAALAFALLVATGLWAHRGDIFAAQPHVDERVFLDAFDAVRQNRSPYSNPTYNYPPSFAVLGAFLDSRLGERRLILLLRYGCLLGVCVAAWLALRATRAGLAVRFGAAALVVVCSFAVGNAFGVGNVSPIVQGLTIAALVLSPTWPIFAGALLGAGVAMKPLAAAVLPLLALYGWRRDRSALRTALAAAATATVLAVTLGWRFAGELWSRAEVLPAGPEHDLSLGRVLRGFGCAVPGKLVFVAVLGLAAWCVLRPRLARRDVHAIALTASVWSVPVVWPHSLLLTLPVQALAVSRVLSASHPRRGWRLGLIALVGAAVFCLNAPNGSDAAPRDWPSGALALVALQPFIAAVCLCALAVRRDEQTAGARVPGTEAPGELAEPEI